MMVWHENIVRSRNDPFDDAWTRHVDLIITHHGFYFGSFIQLLNSCYAKSQCQGRTFFSQINFTMPPLSHDSFLPPRMKVQSITSVNYCSSSTTSQTTDQTDAGWASRVLPHGFSVYFREAHQEACNHLEMSMHVYTVNNCAKQWIEYWFFAFCNTKVKLFSSVTHRHVIQNPFDWLTFLLENYLRVFKSAKLMK